MRLSYAAPFGMKACSIPGCPSSHFLTRTLSWIFRLSAIRQIRPRGIARSIFFSSFRYLLEFLEREVKVVDLPSSTRRAPKTHTLSGPRLYSRGALMRWPSGDHPGVGGKVRGLTGPSSSTQTTVASGGGLV